MEIKICQCYPKAKMVQKHSFWYAQHKVEEREHKVEVLGIFQYAAEGEAEPVAVIKLDDGRVMEVAPTTLTYIKEEEDDEVQNCH